MWFSPSCKFQVLCATKKNVDNIMMRSETPRLLRADPIKNANLSTPFWFIYDSVTIFILVHTVNLKHIYALIDPWINYINLFIPTTDPSIKANIHTIADYKVGVNQYLIRSIS